MPKRKRSLNFSSRLKKGRHDHRRGYSSATETHQATISPFIGRIYPTTVPLFTIGQMNNVCSFCQALRFSNERKNCCHNGKVSLPTLAAYPQEMKEILTKHDAVSKHFQNYIRNYNSAMAFASFGANVVSPPGNGPYCFRVHGQIYHQTGCLYPQESAQPTYSQLYIIEGNQAIESRLRHPHNMNCRRDIMTLLTTVLDQVNPYAAAYKQLKHVEEEQQQIAADNNKEPLSVTMYLKRGNDQRRYNEPRCDEVAAIFVSNDGSPPPDRDIIVYPRDHPPHNISYTSANADPMVYPLLFPHGDLGWYVGIEHDENRKTQIRNTVTLLQFYSYRLAVRHEFSPLFYGSKLFQQYIVDAYVRTEAARLQYIQVHQTDLRVEMYQGLMDHINSRADEQNLKPGKIVILPSSFQGSPRAMMQNYQDAMAIVSKFGKPDLFITFTCNPRSKDITDNLLPGQHASDRPDIVVRVFKQHLKELLQDILDRHVLGIPKAYVYVIEFQKRGLPHCHLLLILANDTKLSEPDDIDSVISAEIPDSESDSNLHTIVRTAMVHGPCGELKKNAVCMVDGVCSKDYPKDFQRKTVIAGNGYPSYKRRDNGRTVTVFNLQLDNRWIVPYNPYLTQKFGAHINVEACTSIKSVKYLFKYVYKGHDCANVEVKATDDLNHDEITHYLDARYVSAPEAFWRLSEFHLHEQSHTIIRLPVHLPDQQPVYFRPGQHEQAVQAQSHKHTKLTAFFKLNEVEQLPFCYTQIANHFVWHAQECKWKPRKRQGERIISRMYSVSPKDFERYCLRLLLLHVTGAKSFQCLRTVNNVTHETFKAACAALNLLADESEWNRAMEEANSFQMPKQLRSLLATILVHCKPHNALELWHNHKASMCEDFVHNGDRIDIAEQKALLHLQSILEDHGLSCHGFGLPNITHGVQTDLEIDLQKEAEAAASLSAILNEDQKAIVNAVMEAWDNIQHDSPQPGNTLFVDGPGGTGKTTVYNALIASFRSQGVTVAASAWTGIAATLLSGGRTCHSLFKLPVPVDDRSVCTVTPTSKHADYLRSVTLFIIDEASMIPLHALRAIDEMLRDITGTNKPFGGRIFLLGGDFRQVLPVIPKRPRTVIIENCLKSSPLWPHFKVYHLKKNMRTATAPSDGFAEWLLRLGNGDITNNSEDFPPNSVQLPEKCHIVDDIVEAVFYNVHEPRKLIDSVILTPTNDSSLQLNNDILKKIPGQARIYYSSDKALCDTEEEANTYPMEFINSLTPSGMPPHNLILKRGAIVMLLRNLDIKKGLCNGTRLIVHRLHDHIIDAEILTGANKGDRVLIPRVKLEPSDVNLPFVLQRIQYPLRLAYSMTINKAQGQTFENLGIYLPSPVFSHGQLYVAFSRAKCFSGICVKIVQSMQQGCFNDVTVTRNVVFKEIL